MTKCVEISSFFASIWACFKSNHRTSDNSIGHACYFKETKAYTTKRRRGSNLDRFRGSLFLYRKSPNLQNHLHFVHTVIYRNHKCKKKIPSFSKRGIKVQKHALSMVSMPCPGGSQTTFKTFVCEMSHKVGLPWVLLKHKLE